MAKHVIEDLQPGAPVDSVFLVVESSLRVARNGKPYLTITLSDRSGQIEGRMWDASEAIAAAIRPEDFVRVRGKAESYRNALQVNIRAITRADTDNVRLRDFLKECPRDASEMLKELTAVLDRVQDADYRAVIDAFLGDEDFCRAFRSAPAAAKNHHACLGGLLEHTLSMARLAVTFAEHYDQLRPDLLLTGVLLHDIGKTRELACKRTFQYTLPGHMVGHIMLGVLMLDERVAALDDFPEEKLHMLRHLILSHHGKKEFGSPKLPMFAEAVALHYLDNLDAKLKEVAEILAADKNADPLFTDYAHLFESKLYKG